MRGMDHRRLRVMAVVLLVGSAAGCGFLIGAAAAGAAYAYVRGEGKQAFPVPLQTARDAVLGALSDLSLPVLHSDQDATSAKIKSDAGSGRDIVIVLTREGEKVTMISVRVGVFGDANYTRMIFDRIEDRLKLM